ncbi:hypothetical protein A2310_00830 [candidate division WOR-1 bacterium RIFOXYB2_FULL_37_13]|uniref:Uncharacterized protein n=1 Tax=candidate division WOR-1 bacterium RIFOXYB2_FULL_37_13 TaxID=1802579 RepID=A0A1F4SRQ4_UNCSA|nr:MAG: hypothetical protein A2310_00830 [candidate division WOR-1 bacterium RIFOXYB2_FULL_37_13]
MTMNKVQFWGDRVPATRKRLFNLGSRLGIPGLSAICARDLALLNEGYLTSAQLATLANRNGFTIENPFSVKIHRSTIIERGVVIGNGVVISAPNCKIGTGTKISESEILQPTLIGKNNAIKGLTVENDKKLLSFGQITIGDLNLVTGHVSISDNTGEGIQIGNNNKLNPNLAVRTLFSGWLYIGNNCDLGGDGGGVISTSYNYGKSVGYPMFVGSLSTKRGAEALGGSAYGITPQIAMLALLRIGRPVDNEADLGNVLLQLFGREAPDSAIKFLEELKKSARKGELTFPPKHVAMFVGVVKPKGSAVVGSTGKTIEVRDGTRLQHSVAIGNADIYERTAISYSLVSGRIEREIKIVDQRTDEQNSIDPGYLNSWMENRKA